MSSEPGDLEGRGYVRFFDTDKGYGFIHLYEPQDKDDQVFFHFTSIRSDQEPGKKAMEKYQLAHAHFRKGDKGWKAVTVIPLEGYHQGPVRENEGGYGGGNYDEGGGYKRGFQSRSYGRGGYDRGGYQDRGNYQNRGYGGGHERY